MPILRKYMNANLFTLRFSFCICDEDKSFRLFCCHSYFSLFCLLFEFFYFKLKRKTVFTCLTKNWWYICKGLMHTYWWNPIERYMFLFVYLYANKVNYKFQIVICICFKAHIYCFVNFVKLLAVYTVQFHYIRLMNGVFCLLLFVFNFGFWIEFIKQL